MGLALRKHPDDAARFTDSLRIRCPASLPVAIDTAAARKLMTPSEYVRRCVIERLEADGIEIATIAPRDAGTLYNVVDGRRCYALISGDRIVTMGYHAAEPALVDFAEGRGDRVLPVEYEDSEPFDISQHWRLPPIDRIEAGRVVRVFPVVPKHWEHA
jgi:hypothetical protein